MIINGLQKISLLDYPEKTAATIFFAGCNFRCPFCHNGDLVLNPEKADKIDEEEIYDFLNKRRGLLDGVCITGGEPFLKKDLLKFISNIKELGFLVKVDTNGSFPNRLIELIDSKLIDYIAMDIKNSKEKYLVTAGLPKMMEEDTLKRISRSIDVLIKSSIDYEFRTTVTKELHNLEDIKNIGEWLNGSKKYVIQNYVDSNKTIKEGYSSHEKDWLIEAKNILNQYIRDVNIK